MMDQSMGAAKKWMQSMDKKTVMIALGTLGGMTALGVTAAAVYNSKQMRTARVMKRTGKIMYQVGTAMRNISGVQG